MKPHSRSSGTARQPAVRNLDHRPEPPHGGSVPSRFRRQRHRTIIPTAMIALVVLLASFASNAGTHTWTGGNASGLWSIGSNWEGNNPPAANESPLHLIFPTNAPRRLATNNIANLTISSIALHGAAYTIAASGQGTNVTIDSSSGNPWWNVRAYGGTGHTLHYSLRLALDGNLEFHIASNASVIVRSPLRAATANSGLLKDGPGTVSLDPIEDNTFDGTATVTDGILRLEGSHVGFGGFTVTDVTVPGALIIGGNNLALHPRCLVWLGNQIADSSPVTVNRNGELLFADVDDTIGSLTMSGGFVDTANGTLTLNGNVIIQNPPSGSPSQIEGHVDLGPIGRFFTVEANAYCDVGAVISGGKFGNVPAGLNKLGPGWLAFHCPSNSFGGDLYVGAGTVSIQSGRQIGAPTNAASVASGGTLALGGIGSGPIVNGRKLNLQADARLLALLDSEWNGPVQLYGKAIIEVRTNITLSIGGVMSGIGGFTKAGPGELILSGFGDNVFTGATCVDDGALWLSKIGLFTNAIAIPGPLTVGTNDAGRLPRVYLSQDGQIAPSVPVAVNRNGQLLLLDHEQTIGALAVNGGVVDSGTFGALRLAGNITSTNHLPSFGTIAGRLELGNTPRSIYVHLTGSSWLQIRAVISGGPAASLTKLGGEKLDLSGANTYAGLTVISEGSLHILHSDALGSAVAGTVVADGASLFMDSYEFNQPVMTVTGETLTLNGGGFNGDTGALSSWGTNFWDGLVILASQAVVRTPQATGRLSLARRVEGPGGLTKIGPGRLIYSGVGSSAFNNTYSGTTIVQDGDLVFGKHSIFHNTALAGDLVIQPSGPGAFPTVRVQGREQFLGANAVTMAPGGWLRIETPNPNSIGSLAGDGVVEFSAGSRLSTGMNNLNTTFAGTIQGGGVNETNLVKFGTGTFTLTGANGLSSHVQVGGGTLRVDSSQPFGRYDVTTPGHLGGTGSIHTVTMRGGYLAPGSPLGKLRAAVYTAAASHWMNIELNGPVLGTGYDQFEVDAAPDLSFTQLGTSFGNGFSPTNGQQFLILRNNSALAIVKPFAGLAEGAKFYVDNFHRVQITYLGGDGNDVVLKVIAGPAQMKGVTVNGNRAYINGCGTPGSSYVVEVTTTVADPASWVGLGNVIAGPDGVMQYIDADLHSHPHRFFRFVAP